MFTGAAQDVHLDGVNTLRISTTNRRTPAVPEESEDAYTVRIGTPSVAPDEDLYEGDSPRPSEEGLPPFDAGLRPVQGWAPRQHCPPCARLSCPVRMLDVPRLPTQLELDWQHPIRGMELRNRLSRWLLASMTWASVLFWGAIVWLSVTR